MSTMTRNVFFYCLFVWATLEKADTSSACSVISVAATNNTQDILQDLQSKQTDCHHLVGGTVEQHILPLSNLTESQQHVVELEGVKHKHRSILDLWPTGALVARSVGHITDQTCRRDVERLVRATQQLDLWSLKMLDSTGKLPAGLLNGNVNQMGDFDQCLSINSHSTSTENRYSDVTGKYCLASLDVRTPRRFLVEDLLHAHNAMVSNFSDPGHRIARFSTANWGVCMPSTCTARELEQVIERMTAGDINEITIKVKVDPKMCYTNENKQSSVGKRLTMLLFGCILAMTFAGTFMQQTVTDGSERSSIRMVLHSFSLKRNWTDLFSGTTSTDEITCLHGARALSALALIIFHKSSAIMFNPYVNRTAMANSLGLAWSVIGRTAIIYTDSFILMSGLLTSHGLLKELDKRGCVNLKERYLGRVWRILPSLIAVILFCTYILVDLGSGPQWGLVVEHHSDLCKANMWRNFLFIHNYFGFENMCLTHTHQLGIDMQLFLISPFLVWLMWAHLRSGLLVIGLIGAFSTALRYTAAFNNQLSPVLYFGVSVSQMFDTANLSYILPSHRATVYLIGLAMGYFMKRVRLIQLTRFQAGVAWLVAFLAGLYAMCGPYEMARKGYQYSATDAALWNAGAPILWSAFLCISLVLCAYGYGGKFNEFLSWPGFVVFTKLAYAVYLTQFPIFFYSVGSQRTAEYYTPFMLVNVAEISVIILVSIVFTLLFDLPFQHIKRISWRTKEIKPLRDSKDLSVHSNVEGLKNIELVPNLNKASIKINSLKNRTIGSTRG